MNVVTILLLTGLIAAPVLFAIWYFSADQRTRRAMRGVPLSPIADATDGQRARVLGTVELAAPTHAPLSGRPCAYWRVTVEERVNRGKSSHWQKLVDEHDGVDFLLRDETGLAYVETSHVNAILERDDSGGSGVLREPSPELEAFLVERGHSTQGWFFNKTLRYREGVAEVGEEVAVVGDVKWERDPDASARAGEGYRDASVPKRLRVRAPVDGTPLLLSDEPSVMS